MQKNIIKTVKNFKLALVALFVMLSASALATAQPGGPTKLAASEASVQAKRAMETLKTINYNRIKDAKRRDAVRRAVSAMKALADNTSPAREPGLLAKLKLAANGLKPRGDHPTGVGQKCMDEAEECDKNGLFFCDSSLIMCLTAEYNEMNKPGQLPE